MAPAHVLTCASLHTKEAPGPEKQQHGRHSEEFGSTNNWGFLGTMFKAQGSYRPSVIGKSRESEGGRWAELLSREKVWGRRIRNMGGGQEGKVWRQRLSCFHGEPQKTLTIILKTSP